MIPHDYKAIDISLIDVREDRLRGAKPDRVETLAKDIAANGLLQPIGVVGEESGRFTLTFGAHRLAAVKALELKEIDARVTPANWIKDQERRLQEVVENLNRERLTKLERAEGLAELKRVYEELHPETRHGGDRKSQAARNKRINQEPIFGFRSEAAERTGLAWSAIKLAVQIATNLSPTTKARVRGTWLDDHQASLKVLSDQTPDMQGRILDNLLSSPPEAANVAEAIILAEGRRPLSAGEKAFRSFDSRWSRFAKREQRAWLRLHAQEIAELMREEGLI